MDKKHDMSLIDKYKIVGGITHFVTCCYRKIINFRVTTFTVRVFNFSHGEPLKPCSDPRCDRLWAKGPASSPWQVISVDVSQRRLRNSTSGISLLLFLSQNSSHLINHYGKGQRDTKNRSRNAWVNVTQTTSQRLEFSTRYRLRVFGLAVLCCGVCRNEPLRDVPQSTDPRFAESQASKG